MTEWSPEQGGCPLSSGEKNAVVLLDYVSGRLDPRRARHLAAHLAQCGSCEDFVSAQAEVWAALDAFEPEPVSLDFDRRLWSRIEEQERNSWWRRAGHWMTPMRQPALTAAVALLAVAFWIGPPPEGARSEAGLDPETIDSALQDLEMLQQFGAIEAPQRGI